MSVVDQVAVLLKDAILSVSDGIQWHPICMKTRCICAGEVFKIRLEPCNASENAYEYHKYDNCIVKVRGDEIPLQQVCFLLNLPLPRIVEGRFDCSELQQAIARKRLQLQEIEVVDLLQ